MYRKGKLGREREGEHMLRVKNGAKRIKGRRERRDADGIKEIDTLRRYQGAILRIEKPSED